MTHSAWRLLIASSLFVSSVASAGLSEYHLRLAPSPSPEVDGYTLHLGTSSRDYSAEFDLGGLTSVDGEIRYAVAFEDTVDLYIAVSAYDSSGLSSVPSNEMVLPALPIEDPAPPPETEGPSGGDPAPAPSDPPPSSGGGGPVAGEPGGGGNPSNPLPAAERRVLSLATTQLGEIYTVDERGRSLLLTVDSLAASGDLRPARCDLDGDGDMDLVLGFGAGSGGQVSILHLEDGAVVSSTSLTAGSSSYRSELSGMTYPSCGDFDGDGFAEIVIGFDEGMNGSLQIFDDQSNAFWPFPSSATTRRGYLRLLGRNDAKLALMPAMGDVDGDGRAELLVGTGAGSGSRIFVLDDAEADFVPHPSVEGGGRNFVPSPMPYNAEPLDVERRVALGDMDGDGVDEIIVSFGPGGGGQILAYEDLRTRLRHVGPARETTMIGVMYAGRFGESRVDSGTAVALSDLDGDGHEEFIIGFDGETGHEIQVNDDVLYQFRPLFDPTGFIVPDEDKMQRLIPAPL